MAKTILITGANGNLGNATVKKMLEKEYKIIAVGNAGSKSDFTDLHEKFEYQAVDLAKEQHVNDFVEDVIKRYKTIDGALLLAGGFAAGGIKATGGDELKRMYSLNFETAYYLTRPLFQHMLQNGNGRITFVGARPAIKAAQGKAAIAYALSKSLLFKLAELLNEEAKGKNVVVSVIVPSTIDTPQNRQSMPDGDFEKWVKAEQIASVLEFICSDIALAIREPVYKMYNNA